ncbi:sensor histidine kinase [Chitinimonas sp.]|uniref:sensor histidine kinase n=1 Tax=Chitinimonas sp. TaxID=1934313 RepID=UPI002F94EA7E
MWQRLRDANRRFEDETIAWLRNPPALEPGASRLRCRLLKSIHEMSEFERRELLAFLLKYRGWNGWKRLILPSVFVLSIVGLNLHFWLPAKFSILEGMLLCNVLGLSFGLGVLGAWFNYRKIQRNWYTSFKFVVMATLGAFVGASMVALVDGRPIIETMIRIGRWVALAGVTTGLLHALVLGLIGRVRARAFELENASLQAAAERERLARQLSESQLRLLEAQIEPHFLFNTLGAVQQLAEQGAPKAAALTASLIQFLRGSLTQMRNEMVSLAEDFARVEAYLQVMQVRMGERLRFELQLPAELAARQLPSMMLLTLVENAIKHGIEPALRGGRIDVVARQEAEMLLVEVRDSGAGLKEGGASGVGLANVRERLALIYGGEAAVSLEENETGGCLARLQLPLAHKEEARA